MELAPFEYEVAEYKGEDIYLPLKVNGTIVDKFRIDSSVGSMPLLEFSHAAKSGLDSEELDGQAAMYSLIKDCIYPEDWDRFRDCVTKYKLKNDAIFRITTTIWSALANRPLENGLNSPDGQPVLNGGESSDLNVSESFEIPTDALSKKPANKRAKTTG